MSVPIHGPEAKCFEAREMILSSERDGSSLLFSFCQSVKLIE